MKELSEKLEHHLYIMGYKGLRLSRLVRKLIAGSRFHRAWLAGFMGSFVDVSSGMPFSVCDRTAFIYRNN